MISTPVLQAGDLVDIVAPGSSAPADALNKGLEVLKSWGLQVRVPEGLIAPSTFFANSDANRLQMLSKALHAPDSKAVWFVRGGSGTHRLLPQLFKGKKPKRPKLILGFSDATSLLVGAHTHWHWPSLHAPVLTQLGSTELVPEDVEELRRLLFGEESLQHFNNLKALNPAAEKLKGRLQGPLIGGNLTVFQNLIGVKESPRTAGAILFFEEIGERGYRIDRTLTHLRQAGYFDKVKAIVLGDFLGGDEPGSKPDNIINRVHWALENFARDSHCPVFTGLLIGHGRRNRALPIGITATLTHDQLVIPFFPEGKKTNGPEGKKVKSSVVNVKKMSRTAGKKAGRPIATKAGRRKPRSLKG